MAQRAAKKRKRGQASASEGRRGNVQTNQSSLGDAQANGIQGSQRRSLYETILGELDEHLAHQRYPLPFRKRAAALTSGLVSGEDGTVSGLASKLMELEITLAKEESVSRRLSRLLDDPRMDPQPLLSDLLLPLLSKVLSKRLTVHERSGCPEPPGSRDGRNGAHGRFQPLRLVLDESSKADQAHLMVVGLAYCGLVLPLVIRVWPQNQPMADGEYWVHLYALLGEAKRLLPPPLREHVLLLADRAYGVPAMVDLLHHLKWDWVLRVQGQTCVRTANGESRTLRELVPQPGKAWYGGEMDVNALLAPPTGVAALAVAAAEASQPAAPADEADEASQAAPLLVFKRAGWRPSYVVGVWQVGQPDPWLLICSLPPKRHRLKEYASRWAIERLFLSWKSHGWNLEKSRIKDPARLARLLCGMALATYWRLAIAMPQAGLYLDDIAARASRHQPPSLAPTQLAFQGMGKLDPSQLDPKTAAPVTHKPPLLQQPWPAKFSLFTWGAKIARSTDCKHQTPALCWIFPYWEHLT